VVDSIRRVDSNHIVFVEGPNFSLASNWPVENPEPFIADPISPPRIVYSPHVYFDLDNDSRYDGPGEEAGPGSPWAQDVRDRLLPAIDWSIAHDVPIFIGETNVPCTPAWADVLDHAFRHFFQPLKISVTLWGYCSPQYCLLEEFPLNLLACPGSHQMDILKRYPGGTYSETGALDLTPSGSPIYADERVSPWHVGTGSFETLSLDFSATGTVSEGSRSLRVHFDRPNFAGVKFTHHFGLDTRRYRTLEFSVFLEGGGRQNFKVFTSSPRPDCDPGDDRAYPADYDAQPELTDFLLPEDFDGDGTVGFLDFLLFGSSYGRQTGDPGFGPVYDLNQDQTVNFPDFLQFVGSYGWRKGGQWHRVEIPLEGIVDREHPIVNGIAFQNMGATQEVFYLDDIYLDGSR
jgi:hypothetical protein